MGSSPRTDRRSDRRQADFLHSVGRILRWVAPKPCGRLAIVAACLLAARAPPIGPQRAPHG
jgi:hypothetical protein